MDLTTTGWSPGDAATIYLATRAGPLIESSTGLNGNYLAYAFADTNGALTFTDLPSDTHLAVYGRRADRRLSWVHVHTPA